MGLAGWRIERFGPRSHDIPVSAGASPDDPTVIMCRRLPQSLRIDVQSAPGVAPT